MLHWLRCGSLAFALDLSTGWLWHLTMDGVEVFQSLYPAVRDRNWATIPTRVTAWSVTGRDYEVIVTLSGVCGNEEIALDWTGQVTASQAGLLQYAFEARARKDFWKNRIGLCIHIPATYAGAPARGIARDGTVTDGALPVSIAPHQPFRNLAQFTFTLPDKRHCTIILRVINLKWKIKEIGLTHLLRYTQHRWIYHFRYSFMKDRFSSSGSQP